MLIWCNKTINKIGNYYKGVCNESKKKSFKVALFRGKKPPQNQVSIVELSLKSPCLHTILGPAFNPYPLFQWYLQSNEIWLNLSMRCRNSAFNVQGSSVIIVVVQVRAMKIYVAAVEALRRKKERQDETQFTTKIGGKTSLGPSYFV